MVTHFHIYIYIYVFVCCTAFAHDPARWNSSVIYSVRMGYHSANWKLNYEMRNLCVAYWMCIAASLHLDESSQRTNTKAAGTNLPRFWQEKCSSGSLKFLLEWFVCTSSGVPCSCAMLVSSFAEQESSSFQQNCFQVQTSSSELDSTFPRAAAAVATLPESDSNIKKCFL